MKFLFRIWTALTRIGNTLRGKMFHKPPPTYIEGGYGGDGYKNFHEAMKRIAERNKPNEP